ncbi:hypothetical protein TcasGA2_TC001536 [Tribolium castaneum]|uniref:Uncharacterized protein n=1 Tax=Tribolium castaneum TaxID=7070 RepID=D7EI54_TRICA|nr:hypothetical protein TcasGA2_TC001536 [Tribolium castaneum]
MLCSHLGKVTTCAAVAAFVRRQTFVIARTSSLRKSIVKAHVHDRERLFAYSTPIFIMIPLCICRNDTSTDKHV